MMRKKGQTLSLGDAPSVVLIVGLIFLIMATIAFVSQSYGNALTANSTAQNITVALNQQLLANTSIAGIVLTIALVGIVLTVLIGVFVLVGRRRV